MHESSKQVSEAVTNEENKGSENVSSGQTGKNVMNGSWVQVASAFSLLMCILLQEDERGTFSWNTPLNNRYEFWLAI
jgi:hypothetical protein